MKHKIFVRKDILFILFVSCSIFYLSSCTKGFEKLNQDPTRPTLVTPSDIITGVEKKASDIVYHRDVNSLVGMLWSQFWAQTQNEAETQYQMKNSSTDALWGVYDGPLGNIQEIKRINSINPTQSSNNENAICEILEVWLYQILVDTYGNVPFSQALKGQDDLVLTSPYDDGAKIYDELVVRLDDAIQKLDVNGLTFARGELIYGGDPAKWRMLANSLKLRIGLRLSEKYLAKGQAIVEAAASGVFQSVSDEAFFPYFNTAPDNWPENDLTITQNQYFVSKTLIDFLIQTDDPRLEKYANPAVATGTFKGKPYGLGSFTSFNEFSTPSHLTQRPDFPAFIVSFPEVQFALAESKARNFDVPGDAATYYENGVRASMDFWGVNVSEINAFLAAHPYDPTNWRDQVSAQKWVALYNQGLEAWFERNRLNFKNPIDGTQFFVAPSTILDPTVSFVPFRLRYPLAEHSTNKVNYEAAAAAVGGDEIGTKLWWQP